MSRLNDSILAVYNDLKKAGVGNDWNFGVALAAQDFYAEEGSNTTHASETNAANHTGKDTYTIPVQEIKLITGTDATGLEIEVYSNLISGLVMIQMLEMGCIQNKVERLVITTKDV